MKQLNPLFDIEGIAPDFEFEARVLEKNNRFNCFMFAPPNYYEGVQETLVFPAPLALFKSFYFNHYEVVYLGFCKYQIYLFPQLRFRLSAYNPGNFPAALKNYHARYSPDIMPGGNFLVVVNINFCKF